jgi:hypothetical protein
VTLHEFVEDQGGEWPKGCDGLRLKKGRVVWTIAYYPDGANGNRVTVARCSPGGQLVARYDRDTEIEFVFPEVAK